MLSIILTSFAYVIKVNRFYMTEDTIRYDDKSFKQVSNVIRNIAEKLGVKLDSDQANAQFRGFTKEQGI